MDNYQLITDTSLNRSETKILLEKKGYQLVADDNDLNRMVIKILLEKNGYLIDEVANGNEVIDKIKTGVHKYSVIWLDIEMPEMDGIECALKLRNDLNYTGTIIGITSHVDFESLNTGTLSGMDTVLSKPISEISLINAIKLFSN